MFAAEQLMGLVLSSSIDDQTDEMLPVGVKLQSLTTVALQSGLSKLARRLEILLPPACNHGLSLPLLHRLLPGVGHLCTQVPCAGQVSRTILGFDHATVASSRRCFGKVGQDTTTLAPTLWSDQGIHVRALRN
jgi:hypothetical protein